MAVITSKVSDTTVTFTVTIQKGDPTDWGEYTSSKTDFGKGMSGRGADYPYYVDETHATGSKSFDKIYPPGKYVGELALRGMGPVDFTEFQIATPAPKPGIYNICWDTTGKIDASKPCPQNFGPNIKPGTTIDIKTDITNQGSAGKAMVGFKINGVNAYSETNSNLAVSSATNLIPWSPVYKGFLMPDKDATLTISVYNQDESYNWVQTDTQTTIIPIDTSPPVCKGITIDLSPPTGIIKGPSLDGKTPGEKATLTATVDPVTYAFPVTFKYRDGSIAGTCKTDPSNGGTCKFIWDSNLFGKNSGNYYIKAYADSICQSTEVAISVSLPISQANFNIRVLDNVTGAIITGATVLVNTVGGAAQSLATNGNGQVTFRVNSGTINVSISKNGYNTFNTVESIFADTTKTYYITPIPPTPTVGDIHFFSVPAGVEIYVDGIDTKKSTVDIMETIISNIKAGDHTWALKLAGYNDANGTTTVPSGGFSTVYVSLSKTSPTTGSLNITSTPMGAEVFIDNMDQKLTSSGATVIDGITPEQHSLKLVMAGYQDYSTAFTVIPGQTIHLNPTLVPLTTIGSLEISTEPSGARILIDDTDTGYATPATINNVKEGSHTYKVILSGYKDVAGKFDITAGQTTTIHLVLEKSAAAEIGVGLAIAIGGAIGLALLAKKK